MRPGGAPLPHSVSGGGGLPPRSNSSTPAKKRRYSFVPPTTGRPSGDVVPLQLSAPGGAPGGVLPLHLQLVARAPDGVVPPQLLAAARAGRAHTTPLYNAESSFTNPVAWDGWSTASAPPLGYEDAGDDRSPARMPVFDWTPSMAATDANDPLDNTQSFVALLTQEGDQEVEVLTEIPTSSGGGKGRGGSFRHDEDIQLCRSWNNISTDPVVANDQPKETYWNRIFKDYHENKTFPSDRSASSLEKRMQTIQRECIIFQGFYENIESAPPSGVPHTEYIKCAQQMYAEEFGKASPFLHCWMEIRHSEKFINIHQQLKEARARKRGKSTTATQADDLEPDSSMPPAPDSSKRPPGRKQSKQKMKRSQDVDEYINVLGTLVQMKSEEKKEREERWKGDKEIEKHKMDLEKHKMDLEKHKIELDKNKMKLEERKFKWEQEKELMFCNLDTMDETQRSYVLAMRTQLARDKMAALKGSAGGATSCASDHGSGGDGGGAEFSSI